MRSRTCRKIGLLVLIAMLLAAGSTVFAEQEAELHTDYVELFSTGGFPTNSPVHSTFATEDFELYMLRQLNSGASVIDVSAYRLTHEEFKMLYWSKTDFQSEWITELYRRKKRKPRETVILPLLAFLAEYRRNISE